MNSLTVLNFLLVVDLYIRIRNDGEARVDARRLHDKSLGEIFRSVENIQLPFINQVHHFESTESSLQFSDEDILPNKRILRRTAKKNKAETRKRLNKNKRKKKKAKPLKFVKTTIQDYSNQSGSFERRVKVKPFDIVVHIKLNE